MVGRKTAAHAAWLLPAYVVFETIRAVFFYAAVQSGIPISSTFVSLCSELCKAAFATAILLRYIRKQHGHLSLQRFISEIHTIQNEERNAGKPTSYTRFYVRYMVPSVLHLLANILYLVALRLAAPGLRIATLAEIPFIAIAHHYTIQSQRSKRAWLSLIALCFGLIITVIPEGFGTWLYNMSSLELSSNDVQFFANIFTSMTGILIGILVAAISGFASIYMEVLMKENTQSWVAQFWIYTFGSLFAAVAFTLWDGEIQPFQPDASTPLEGLAWKLFDYVTPVTAIVVATAATGLCTANILRKQDNLVKIIGTSASIVTMILAQGVLFELVRERVFSPHGIAGVGIISVAAWTFHYFKLQDISRGAYAAAHVEDQKEDDAADAEVRDNSGIIVPTKRRVFGFIVAIMVLASMANFYQPQATAPQTSTPEAAQPIPSSSTPAKVAPKIVDDYEQFFVPRNLTPSVWGEKTSDIRCVEDWSLEYALPKHPDISNWELDYLNSGCRIYPIPPGGMMFHVYWSGKWRPFNDYLVEAWLATQRLEHGHRLIYWYEGSGPPQEVREKFQKYSQYVEYREFDAVKEGQGYCVNDMPEWNNGTYLEEHNMLIQTLSDIIRYFLLARYGGVWLDADTIPMRDLTPMFRAGPTASSFQRIGWNTNLLVFGPADTRLTQVVLNTTCRLSADEKIYRERFAGQIVEVKPWYWLWNTAIVKACENTLECGINRIPIVYTDGFRMNDSADQDMGPCEPDEDTFEAGKEMPATLHTLFTWHARLAKYDDACSAHDRPTVAGAVRRRIREFLDGGLDMRGRALFPGPELGIAPPM